MCQCLDGCLCEQIVVNKLRSIAIDEVLCIVLQRELIRVTYESPLLSVVLALGTLVGKHVHLVGVGIEESRCRVSLVGVRHHSCAALLDIHRIDNLSVGIIYIVVEHVHVVFHLHVGTRVGLIPSEVSVRPGVVFRQGVRRCGEELCSRVCYLIDVCQGDVIARTLCCRDGF